MFPFQTFPSTTNSIGSLAGFCLDQNNHSIEHLPTDCLLNFKIDKGKEKSFVKYLNTVKLQEKSRIWQAPILPSPFMKALGNRWLDFPEKDTIDVMDMQRYMQMIDASLYIPQELILENLTESLKLDYMDYKTMNDQGNVIDMFTLGHNDEHWIAYVGGELFNEIHVQSTQQKQQNTHLQSLKLGIKQLICSPSSFNRNNRLIAARYPGVVSLSNLATTEYDGIDCSLVEAVRFGTSNCIHVEFNQSFAGQAGILCENGTVCLWNVDTSQSSLRYTVHSKVSPAEDNRWKMGFFGAHPSTYHIIGSKSIYLLDFRSSSFNPQVCLDISSINPLKESFQVAAKCKDGITHPFKMAVATTKRVQLIDTRYSKNSLFEWTDLDPRESVTGIEMLDFKDDTGAYQLNITTWNRHNGDIVIRNTRERTRGLSPISSFASTSIRPFYKTEAFEFYNRGKETERICTYTDHDSRAIAKPTWPPLLGLCSRICDGDTLDVFQITFDGSVYQQKYKYGDKAHLNDICVDESVVNTANPEIEAADIERPRNLFEEYMEDPRSVNIEDMVYAEYIAQRDRYSPGFRRMGGFDTNVYPPPALSDKVSYKNHGTYELQNVWKFLRSYIDPENPDTEEEQTIVDIPESFILKCEEVLNNSATFFTLYEYNRFLMYKPLKYDSNNKLIKPSIVPSSSPLVHDLTEFTDTLCDKFTDLKILRVPVMYNTTYEYSDKLMKVVGEVNAISRDLEEIFPVPEAIAEKTDVEEKGTSSDHMSDISSGDSGTEDYVEDVANDMPTSNSIPTLEQQIQGKINKWREFGRDKALDWIASDIFLASRTMITSVRSTETEEPVEDSASEANNTQSSASGISLPPPPKPQSRMKITTHLLPKPILLSQGASELRARWLDPDKYYEGEYSRRSASRTRNRTFSLSRTASTRKNQVYQEMRNEQSQIRLEEYLNSQVEQSFRDDGDSNARNSIFVVKKSSEVLGGSFSQSQSMGSSHITLASASQQKKDVKGKKRKAGF